MEADYQPPRGESPEAHPSDRVVSVVVTRNRCALLLEALAALGSQTRRPDAVVVVDNGSTDGTTGAIRSQHANVDLVSVPRNTGGAGGFAIGISAALAQGANLLWIMDDDTVPMPGALEALLEARRQYPGSPPAVIASRTLWKDGRAHPMNTPRPKPFARAAERAAAAAVGCVPVRTASFVSILVDAGECRRRGLPIADYFLWNDDFEFTARLLRGGTGLLNPASVVVHKTATFGSTDADPGPDRFFYEVRNKIWMLTRSNGLGPAERSLYGGSTILRWGRTFARSRSRVRLARALAAGVAAGLRRGPRPNHVVLGDLPDALVPVEQP